MQNESSGLNEKQQMFADQLPLCDFNATQAAINAGYSAKTASATASRLLRHVNVQAALAMATKKRSDVAQVDAAWVLLKARESFEINAAIKFNDDGDAEMVNATAAGKFLDQVGKHNDVSAFTENLNHTGSVSIAIADILESIDGTSKGLPVDE